MFFNMHICHCHSISFLLHIIIATIKTLFMHLFFSFSLNHIQVFLVHIEEISLIYVIKVVYGTPVNINVGEST